MLATPQVARIGGDSFEAQPEWPAGSGPGSGSPSNAHRTEVVVLVLTDCATAWVAWYRLVAGAAAFRGVPGLRFCKVLGTGHEGGFGLRPSMSRRGLFCIFDTAAAAAAFLDASPQMAAYRRHARELCTVTLHPYWSIGRWSGVSMPVTTAVPAAGPVAALTRASIRPSRARSFWRLATPAQRALESAHGCQLAVGLGEAPVLRQATFSIWDSVADMDAYARQGAHLAAIEASRRDDHFTESMFARFVPVGLQGVWKGRRFE